MVSFTAVFSGENGKFAGPPVELRMSPAPQANAEIPDLPNTVPEPIRRSLNDTIRAFNAQIYGATATSGRRTLEGIFKYIVPEEQRTKNLYELITSAEAQIDFREPLSRLANAIRQGGNLGAHFDEEREPDVLMAAQMIELLQYLIEYLYVLPSQIQKLEKSIEGMPEGGKA